jgi:hypothetical protein
LVHNTKKANTIKAINLVTITKATKRAPIKAIRVKVLIGRRMRNATFVVRRGTLNLNVTPTYARVKPLPRVEPQASLRGVVESLAWRSRLHSSVLSWRP